MADTAQEMRLYQTRLDSFGSQKKPSKKRKTSNVGANTTSWPHVTPSAADLAFAGFYYNPVSHTEDNVNCFHCHVKLDGWEIDDVPIKEHLAHSPDCAWALATSVTLGNEDRDPMSEQMLTARIATFANSWPHEEKSRHRCKSKRMAEAGWCMDPSPGEKDGATCFYCNLSLDGWMPKDDPTAEHSRRQPDCPFFVLSERYASTRPKKSRARTSTASKASRLSIHSTFSEAPSLMSLGDPEPTLDGDTSIASVMSTASTIKGRKAAAPKKPTRGKKKATRAPSVDNTDMVTALDETLPAEVEHSVQYTQDVEVEEIKQAPAKKTAKGRAKSKKAQPALTESQEAEQLESTEVEEVEEKKPATKTKRGKKRTSDGEEKTEAVVAAVELPAPEEEPVAPPKKAKGTRTKKTKILADDTVQESQLMEVDPPAPEPEAVVEESKPKKGRKPKATKAKKVPTPEPESVHEPSPEVDMDINDENDDSGNFVVHAADDDDEPNFVIHDQSQDIEPSPTPQIPPTARPATPPPAIVSKASTPASAKSTASSDAENHPPSSVPPVSHAKLPPAPALAPITSSARPTAFTSPTKTTRIPLATQTPNRASPQKLGALKSSTPWTPTDIETVFLASEARDKDVGAQLAALGGKLSSPERKMSVEEWVRWQAEKGEERLREECEKMVWVFEKEGTRALGVLGGLQVRS